MFKRKRTNNDHQNIKESRLTFKYLFFVVICAIWKFNNDIEYKIIKKNDPIKNKQMLKIELKSNTTLITKSLL